MSHSFIVDKGNFFANIVNETSPRLPPGAYTINVDQLGQIYFQPFVIRGDDILDLPSKEYSLIVGEMGHFLNPATRDKFKSLGYLYKRSSLLHGAAGVGKSVLLNRVARDVVKSGGVVLSVTNPGLLEHSYHYLESIQPDVVTLTLLEEFDEMLKRGHETTLLKILDAQIQKQNVITLATTNFVDKIPKRMIRPGRFSSVIEILYPTAEARKVYLTHKLGPNYTKMDSFVEKTNGLSIDELKECVQSVEIFGKSLDDVVAQMLKTRTTELVTSDGHNEEYDDGDSVYPTPPRLNLFDYHPQSILRKK